MPSRDWKHPHDPEPRITRLKNGLIVMAHKADHAVDLDSGTLVAVTVQPGDRGDGSSQEETLEEATGQLIETTDLADTTIELDRLLREVVAKSWEHLVRSMSRNTPDSRLVNTQSYDPIPRLT